MLKKENRLTKDKEFQHVFKKGFSCYDKLLGVKAVQNDLKNCRFGIIVSKKVSKSAVKRNKIKRTIRDILKLELCCLKLKYDIVIIVLLDLKNNRYQNFQKSLKIHFKKLKL